MRLIAKLTSLIKAVARGPASRPSRPPTGNLPDGQPIDDAKAGLSAEAHLDTAQQDGTRDTMELERGPTIDRDRALENERVADLLERRQASADRQARERGERR